MKYFLLLLVWCLLVICCDAAMIRVTDTLCNDLVYESAHVFYVASTLSRISDSALHTKRLFKDGISVTSFSIGVRCVVGVIVFAYASVYQCRSHVTLAALRSHTSTSQNKPRALGVSMYRIPRGGWFETVTMPHYLAEILVYASLLIIRGGRLSEWYVLLVHYFNISIQ
jgi:3-oxo-5-alpha-steroid 4-dehydrogenase